MKKKLLNIKVSTTIKGIVGQNYFQVRKTNDLIAAPRHFDRSTASSQDLVKNFPSSDVVSH